MEEALLVKNLSLSLENRLLLKELDFSLPQGASLTIIGESGSGKTLLTKLLIGEVPAGATISGDIDYQEQPILSLPSKALHALRGKKIAYMVQNPMAMFNPFNTIKTHFIETIKSHQKLSRSACLDLAITSMKALRLGHGEKLLQSYPFELSGGMLQRVMLAMLLCLDPDWIILDEPTSALDAYNRDNILTILKDLQAKGKQLITVTHDYELARELGGFILVMSQGQIVEFGPAQTVLESPHHPYTQDLVLTDPYERLVANDWIFTGYEGLCR